MWSREGKESMSQSDLKMLRCGLEDEERGHELRNAGSLWKLGKARKQIQPQSHQKEHSPADTLLLVQYNSEIINRVV